MWSTCITVVEGRGGHRRQADAHPIGGAARVDAAVGGERSKAKELVVSSACGDVSKDALPQAVNQDIIGGRLCAALRVCTRCKCPHRFTHLKTEVIDVTEQCYPQVIVIAECVQPMCALLQRAEVPGVQQTQDAKHARVGKVQQRERRIFNH